MTLLGATKRRAKWTARAGPMVFLFGCLLYARAYYTGQMHLTVLGGMMWMSSIMQWSLEHMEVDR